ncbi:MAG: S1 RNA-binding domain-containing protein [Phycisphaerae bacterium]|nr:S1 RNA-binding domain-containing protein [Phycisphaerae bacterium]NUQ48162.1 S1 RNA-binding domain-containing protein [Phycisphaerae bacterium]
MAQFRHPLVNYSLETSDIRMGERCAPSPRSTPHPRIATLIYEGFRLIVVSEKLAMDRPRIEESAPSPATESSYTHPSPPAHESDSAAFPADPPPQRADAAPPSETPGTNDHPASPPAAHTDATHATSTHKPLPAGIDRAELDREVEAAMAGLDMKQIEAIEAPVPLDRVFELGAVVSGAVLSCTERDVLLDLGGKVQGVLSRDELLPGYEPPAGTQMNVLVDEIDAAAGLLKVSKKRADAAVMWRDLKIGDVVEGIVTGMNKGGLEVAVGLIKAFIPASQVDTHFVRDISELFGKTVRCEVTKIEREDQNLIVSRRKVLEREAEEAKKRALTEIEVGQVRHGRVRNVTDFGAFVELGGVDGMIHVSDMSYGRIAKASDVLKVGDEVDVKVLKINRDTGKVSLGLKQLKPHPWETLTERFQAGTTVSGRVMRHADFGAFVELEPGVEGLIALPELSWHRRIRHPREVVREGDVVNVKILSIDVEKRRVALSLKQVEEDPWANIAEKYPLGSKVQARVVRLADFGAFVEIVPGVEAMIHISELSTQRVNAVSDVLKPDQQVEARVIRVDSDNRKIALSLRPEAQAPPPEEAERKPAAAPARKKPSKPRRGGIDFSWDESLTRLDPSRFAP